MFHETDQDEVKTGWVLRLPRVLACLFASFVAVVLSVMFAFRGYLTWLGFLLLPGVLLVKPVNSLLGLAHSHGGWFSGLSGALATMLLSDVLLYAILLYALWGWWERGDRQDT